LGGKRMNLWSYLQIFGGFIVGFFLGMVFVAAIIGVAIARRIILFISSEELKNFDFILGVVNRQGTFFGKMIWNSPDKVIVSQRNAFKFDPDKWR
ncbi:MAG: hypothetical protein ACTSWA_05300, partial [Candidatus Thorarchaeota archaeon]